MPSSMSNPSNCGHWALMWPLSSFLPPKMPCVLPTQSQVLQQLPLKLHFSATSPNPWKWAPFHLGTLKFVLVNCVECGHFRKLFLKVPNPRVSSVCLVVNASAGFTEMVAPPRSSLPSFLRSDLSRGQERVVHLLALSKHKVPRQSLPLALYSRAVSRTSITLVSQPVLVGK